MRDPLKGAFGCDWREVRAEGNRCEHLVRFFSLLVIKDKSDSEACGMKIEIFD